MTKKKLIVLVLLIVVLLVGVFLHNRYRANKTTEQINDRQQAIEDVLQRSDITINTKHQYSDGVHVFLGTFETLTPCDSHSVKILERDGLKEIAISYQEAHDETGESLICDQVITERQFRVSFEGPEDASVIATLNGDLVNLNIFEVREGENIEDVNIYIKG